MTCMRILWKIKNTKLNGGLLTFKFNVVARGPCAEDHSNNTSLFSTYYVEQVYLCSFIAQDQIYGYSCLNVMSRSTLEGLIDDIYPT